MDSYGNVPLKPLARVRELLSLYRQHRARGSSEAHEVIASVAAQTAAIEHCQGIPLRGQKILEIGPGQLMKRARIFAVHNVVVGIEPDAMPAEGWRDGLTYLRDRGFARSIKTLGRRALRFDTKFLAELHQLMPETRTATIKLRRARAEQTGLDDKGFDVTLSTSVFEHIANPVMAVREMVRITKPGGVFCHVVHPYTSTTGAHDPRSFHGADKNFPHWAHLRPKFKQHCQPNCYLNGWGVVRWEEMFRAELPGVQLERLGHSSDSEVAAELAKIRADGELMDFDPADLLTECVMATWRKPGLP